MLLAPLPLFVPASGVTEPEPCVFPGRGVYAYVHMGYRMSPWKLTSLGSLINIRLSQVNCGRPHTLAVCSHVTGRRCLCFLLKIAVQ